MKIKVIATGSSKFQRFMRRWGVSFLIGEDVLFDTFGDPGVFMNNLPKLQVDIGKIKHIVLSHDDWDHIAGLWYLLPNRQDITVYICPGFKKEIKERIVSFGAKIIEAGQLIQVRENIYTTGELYGESGGRKIYEQSVVIKEKNGLAVLCGCAHPGVEKIIERAKDSFKTNISSLIGGFHLKDNTNEVNGRIIKELNETGIRRIMPMHCTGKRAVELIRQSFGEGFAWLKEGDEIEL
ncbi:MAG: MBL fold metallo-hydrolase [Candidatus Omnitrophica bacterium]|nr:MBL fold metallo-hydrolase [Candidatus Omnitrophota bacterium]